MCVLRNSISEIFENNNAEHAVVVYFLKMSVCEFI